MGYTPISASSQNKRMPVDPRIVRRVQGSSRMMREQGSDFMGRWGGPTMYRKVAKMDARDRMAYMAIQDGFVERGDIAEATGMPLSEVDQAIASLKKEGEIVEEDKEVAQL